MSRWCFPPGRAGTSIDGRRNRRYKLSTTISRIVVDGPWIPGCAAAAAERPQLASRKADDLSREGGVITVLPDIPINAGGVMVFRVEAKSARVPLERRLGQRRIGRGRYLHRARTVRGTKPASTRPLATKAVVFVLPPALATCPLRHVPCLGSNL